jgi:Soluble NSF attachment protein, SNAP
VRVGAFSTAAAEYTRAAELLELADDEELTMKREVGRKLHLIAAEAWSNMNEPAKAASSKVRAALALVWGDDSNFLPKTALEAVEEAIEDHVPDPLNPYARYRQTGMSAYINPDSNESVLNPSAESLELAKQKIVTRPYSHESVQEVMYLLISFGEYASALYSAGAVTALLSNDGVSTLTLSRSFLAETILSLSMGDPIAAEENFLNRHVQQSSYLTSRECKLAEELFRAVKVRDGEALEEARSPSGPNRAAIGNLHESLRDLVSMIRLSGVARRGVPESYETKEKGKRGKPSEKELSINIRAKPPAESLEELANEKTGYEKDVDEVEGIDAGALQDELDALDFGDDDSEVSDDSLDLR